MIIYVLYSQVEVHLISQIPFKARWNWHIWKGVKGQITCLINQSTDTKHWLMSLWPLDMFQELPAWLDLFVNFAWICDVVVHTFMQLFIHFLMLIKCLHVIFTDARHGRVLQNLGNSEQVIQNRVLQDSRGSQQRNIT